MAQARLAPSRAREDRQQARTRGRFSVGSPASGSSPKVEVLML